MIPLHHLLLVVLVVVVAVLVVEVVVSEVLVLLDRIVVICVEILSPVQSLSAGLLS
jgi:hypothetical protein